MKAKKPHYTQVGAKRYDYDGQSLTIRELGDTYGVPVKTVQSRMSQGWDVVRAMETPLYLTNRGGHQWRTRGLRAAALAHERSLPRGDAEPKPRTVEDVPLERDPWSQAAIDVAAEDGGFTLDEVGDIQGGVSLERIRQVQESAFRKIRSRASLGDEDCIAFLSHWEDRRET